MDIYDPIGVALGLEPIHFEFTIPKLSNPIPSWNKGINQFGSKNNHPWYGKKHSEETKEKMRLAAVNRNKKIKDIITSHELNELADRNSTIHHI